MIHMTETKQKPNWQNRTLFHGDNLDFLRAMNTGTVDLIATDPPFNKGRDFHATPDSLASGASFQDRWSWQKDVHPEWVDQITDDFPDVMNVIEGSRLSYGDDMGAFLCFMAVRLLAMKRVLKDTGSIYLHCDPTASHYLKQLMDAIFGKENFKNEIIWKRTGSHNSAKRYAPIHDIILFYGKNDDVVWNRILQPYDKKYLDSSYRYNDEKGRYRLTELTGSGTRTGESGKPWKDVDFTMRGRHWAIPPKRSIPDWFDFPKKWNELSVQQRLDQLDQQGLVDWGKDGKRLPRFKKYLLEGSGVPLHDLITDILPVHSSFQRRNGLSNPKTT